MSLSQTHKNKYQNQQGSIALESVETVEAVSEKEKTKHPNCFKVVTPGRTYIISTPTQSEMNRWIDLTRDAKLKLLQSKGLVKATAINPELEVRTLPELESMLSTLDSKRNEEITVLLDDCQREKDLIIDELMRREVRSLLEHAHRERLLLSLELERRRTK
jgi:hypothetical protein